MKLQQGIGELPGSGVWQRTGGELGDHQGVVQPAPPAAGKTVQEIKMSKGNRGNKEAKKPKLVPVVKSPTAGTAVAASPVGTKPTLQKK